ncbi:MAG: sodium:solute symporter [Clostridia bacterium]|nr:sodium:solute symporter [Clostridia bacterium]
MVIKITLLVVFFALMVGIGIYCRKSATDVNGFVLGGRSVGPWLTAFAYGTSYFSAVIFIGYAGQFGWKYGIASTWIGIGNAILGSLLAWVVLGRRTRIMTQTLGSSTMPEFFERRYGSKALKVVASAITFIFLIPYTASLYNGLSRLFEMAFGIDYMWCVISMSILTGIYVIAGGYMATAISDFIQGTIMLVGIVAVIGAVLSSHGGFIGALNELSIVPVPKTAGPASAPGAFASMFGPDPLNLLGVVILTSLGTWGLPQMVQKFYAIKSEKAISRGTIISTIFAVIVAGGCYFLGGFARISGVEAVNDVPVGGFDTVIPKMLESLPDLLMAIVIVLVLSASMSTLSSLVLASSSTLTLDFVKDNISKNMSEKKQVSVMRVFIVVFIVISAVIAIFQHKAEGGAVAFIAQLMGVSWGALAGAFLAPFLYGLYAKWVTKAACWVSMIFGAGIMIVNLLFRSSFPTLLQSPINCGAFAMVAGLILVPIVSLITKKPDVAITEKAFSDIKARLAEDA